MPNLTERSVFKIGEGGLAMTIPKPWWSYYQLEPGDKVQVISDGKLVVKPLRNRRSQSKGGER